MRVTKFVWAAALVLAVAGCGNKTGPVVVTPEIEAEQRRAEKEVRDAETNYRKTQKAPDGQSTAEDQERQRQKTGRRD